MADRERRSEGPTATQATVPTARWSGAVRRAHPRFDVACAVTLQPAGAETTITGTTVDVSRGGALVRTEHSLDEAERHLVVFLPDANAHAFAGHTCPDCGSTFGGRRLARMAVWARVVQQERGGGDRPDNWLAALEFERLIELPEDEPDGTASGHDTLR